MGLTDASGNAGDDGDAGDAGDAATASKRVKRPRWSSEEVAALEQERKEADKDVGATYDSSADESDFEESGDDDDSESD
jgi:hypothetical protein